MMMIIIITATMALSFNRGYHWRNGCPELNYVYPLCVNICLEKAVKPIDTFYSFCRTSNVDIWLPFFLLLSSSFFFFLLLLLLLLLLLFFFFFFWGGGGGGGFRGLRFVEAIFPFLLYRIKNRIQNSVSVRWSIQIEKIGSAYYIYIHISYISYTHHIHITLVLQKKK